MDTLWNDPELKNPPVNTYKSSELIEDVFQLQTIIFDAICFMENQKCLHQEAAIVSRLMYIMSRKFRHDIGHSYMRRTNVALLKYLNLDILKDLKTFSSVLPSHTSINCDLYLPTRQMLEFILVRFQTFSQILFRILVCSRNASTFYFERIKRGDSAWLSLMPYTVLSRIWLLTKLMVKNSCKWFNKLLPFKAKLKLIGVAFLPPNYSFPENLYEWLNFEAYESEAKLLWKPGAADLLPSFLESISVDTLEKIRIENHKSLDRQQNSTFDDSDFCELLTKPKNIQPTRHKLNNFTTNDIGVKVSRKDYAKFHNMNMSSELSRPLDLQMDEGVQISRKDLKTMLTTNEYCNKSEMKIFNIDPPHKSFDKLSTHKQKSNKNSNICCVKDSEKSLNVCDQSIGFPLYKSIQNCKKKSTLRSPHTIASIKCSKSLLKFLKTEESFRTTNDPLSLTKNISLLKWLSLKKVSLKISKKIEGNNIKQEKNLKKLKDFWVEQCV